MLPYEFTGRAERDLAAARDWYDKHGTDLGNRFLDSVDQAISLIRQLPETFPEKHRGVRAVRCRRFPYRVYYQPEAARIVILAVYHTARDPNRWDDPRRD